MATDKILTVSEGQLLFVHSLIYWATHDGVGINYEPDLFDTTALPNHLLNMDHMRKFDDYGPQVGPSPADLPGRAHVRYMIPGLEPIQVKGQTLADTFTSPGHTKDAYQASIRHRTAYQYMRTKVREYLNNERLAPSRDDDVLYLDVNARDWNRFPDKISEIDVGATSNAWIDLFEKAVVLPLTDDFTSDTLPEIEEAYAATGPYWSGPRARATAKAQTRFDLELIAKKSEWTFQWEQVVAQMKDKMYDRRMTAQDNYYMRDVDFSNKLYDRRTLYRDNKITRKVQSEEAGFTRMIQMFDAGSKFVNLERDELLKRALVGMQAGELQRGIYSQRRMVEFQNWLRQQPLMNPALEYAMTASGQPLYTAVGGGGGGGGDGGRGGSDYSWVAPLAQGGFGFLSQLIFN